MPFLSAGPSKLFPAKSR
uniref:Uncharacterized protein n=1 Tax=Rhizophora mucronata TaxID=61149 RepID=A0A2P2N9R2_RHIMU